MAMNTFSPSSPGDGPPPSVPDGLSLCPHALIPAANANITQADTALD
ncbi:MAG: hypothetical protein WC809_06945 [Sinimarinibacterium sp.]